MKHSKAFRRRLSLPWQYVWVAIHHDFNLLFLFQKRSKQNRTTDWLKTRAGDLTWAGLELCSAARPALAVWWIQLQPVWVRVSHFQLATQRSVLFCGTTPSLFHSWLWHFVLNLGWVQRHDLGCFRPSYLFTWRFNGLICVKATLQSKWFI